tara:strand:- start:265 stop:1224 length:960 start_codon:yes stop_codon:yes gene_type:complete
MDPSSLTKTGFCGKTVDNVTTNEVKEFILNHMKLNCGGIQYTSRYAKIYNEQYSRNLNNPHILCLKSSGTPYLLYFTQINGVNYSFLIDKKVKVGYDFPKIFVIPYTMDPSVYTGSLFDVELVRDKQNEWLLLIGDCYYFKSQNYQTRVIMNRMNAIHTMMKTEYQSDSFGDVCPIQVKRYFDYKDKDTILNEVIPGLNYGTRGFYFVPLKCSYAKILYLFKEKDKVQSKTKPKSKATLYFLIQKTLKRDVYELYLQGPNNIVKLGIAAVPNLKCSQMLRELFTENTCDVYVECKYNEKFKKWEPLKPTTQPLSRVSDV